MLEHCIWVRPKSMFWGHGHSIFWLQNKLPLYHLWVESYVFALTSDTLDQGKPYRPLVWTPKSDGVSTLTWHGLTPTYHLTAGLYEKQWTPMVSRVSAYRGSLQLMQPNWLSALSTCSLVDPDLLFPVLSFSLKAWIQQLLPSTDLVRCFTGRGSLIPRFWNLLNSAAASLTCIHSENHIYVYRCMYIFTVWHGI